MTIKSAIILCGGGGTRIWPYSEVRNKCAMPVANVPNVRRIVDQLSQIGMGRIVVVLGSHPGSIRAALLGAIPKIEYVDQPTAGGTAGAVLEAWKILDDERVLVVYGDVVTTIANFRAVASTEEDEGAVLWDEVPAFQSGDWYIAHMEKGKLTGITGHDRGETKRLCGVLALSRSIIPDLEANPGLHRNVPVGGMPPLEADLAQSISDWKADIAAVKAVDFVVDMDKPWHILEANMKMAAHLTASLTENRIHPSARVHDGAEIEGFVHLGESSVIGNRVVAKGNLIAGANSNIVNGPMLQGAAVIGDNCRVDNYCILNSNSVIGHNCVLGHGAEMDGVMFDGAYLWHYCEICGLVGASVDIGAATVCGTLRFDDGDATQLVKGRRERPSVEANATYFGDYSRTGVNVITMPGVKIGIYSCVGAGIVVYDDIPDRTMRLLTQDTVDRKWGPEKYGW
jgi:NDP-sugar pyrophosphorylase family protein